MFIATFDDGTSYRFDRIHGKGFDPRDGGKYLIAFPCGLTREGTVRSIGPAEHADERRARAYGIYDREARTIEVEV
jgi:hypothetical protein